MGDFVSKKICYREAVFSNCEKTLQQLIDQALTDTEARNRQEKLNENEETFRFLNKHEKYRGVTFCQMLQVDPGANQPVLIYGANNDIFKLDAVSTSELTKEELKKNSDFVNSMLYFGVKDNEVIVMPSQALPARSLESHLMWLLGNKLSILPNDAGFILRKRQSKKLEELLQNHPVKSIEIGSALVGEEPSARDLFSSGESFNIGLAAVKDMIGAAFQDSWLNGVTEEANLTARIVISYRRSTDDAGRQLMNRLGQTLRNLEDADVKLTLKDYGEIKGEELSLSKMIKIEKTERGLYVDGDIYSGMVSWLIDLQKEKS